MASTTLAFDRVYIWEWPVRLYHWATAASVLVLVATGLLIGAPPAFLTSGDASASHWFGLVRFLHFVSGYVFLFAFVIRVYWMFAGNQYARWSNFFPLTPSLVRRQVTQALKVIKVDMLQIDVQPMEVKGHNALAAWSYAGIFLLTIFEVATGFALLAATSDAWLPQLFAWVVPAMGGDASVRLWHHVATWVFVLFTLVHVYLCLYHDVVEGEGEISSMISGAKFVHKK